MDPVLSLRDVRAGYSGRAVIHDVSFDLPVGGSATILGPNGSGKSTLLKTLVGLLSPLSGLIRMQGRDIARLDASGRSRAGMAYVPQERNIFYNMSVRENLLMGIEFMPAGRDQNVRVSRQRAVLEMFPVLGDRLDDTAGHLSGGQRQMLAIASALMQNPALLVLDEPSAGLSPLNAATLFENIRNIRATGISMLLIEQNARLGLSVADTGIILAGGQIRLAAPAGEISPACLHAYYLGAAK
jgi:branched-chain amino acid transport system ATP-binding protein